MMLGTDCPICQLEHIPDDRDRCPQCDSDLTCFRVLETLREPEAQTAEPAMPEINPRMTQTANKRTTLFYSVSGLLLGALTIMSDCRFIGSRVSNPVSWNSSLF